MARDSDLTLTVFVSCYNEASTICGAFDTIRTALQGFDFSYELLVYDDASVDSSVSVIRNYITHHGLEEQSTLVANERNVGIGVNYFRAAEAGRGEYLLAVHGDNAIESEAFHEVIDLRGRADIIAPHYGTRLLDGEENFDHRSFGRRLVSLVFSALVRLLSGHDLTYFNGLCLLRRSAVVENRVFASGLGYQAELLCRLLEDPSVTYLEVRQHNRALAQEATTAFAVRSILSVAGSLARILWRRLVRAS